MATSSVGLQTHIWNNNLKSVLLLAGFPFLLLMMTWAIIFAHTALPYMGTDELPDPTPFQLSLNQTLYVLPWVLLGTLIWFTIAWFSHQKIINRATGAQRISREVNPRIYNLLENLCISRGITMPKLYLIDSNALNAYASGISDKSYAITLTYGIVDALNDDELEAVLAHELTHIINKDVRLLIISIIFVGIISFLAEMAWRNMHYARSGNRIGTRRNSGRALPIAAIILGVGYLFAILLRFTLSRKREYLADAGSVELTKKPDAMASALRKISGRANLKGVPGDVRQLCIENPPAFFSLFSTHPPIDARIAALEKYAGARKLPPEPEHKGPWGAIP